MCHFLGVGMDHDPGILTACTSEHTHAALVFIVTTRLLLLRKATEDALRECHFCKSTRNSIILHEMVAELMLES